MENKEELALIDADHILYLICPEKKEQNIETGAWVRNEDGIGYKTVKKTFEEKCRAADYYMSNVLHAVGATKYIGVWTEKCFRYNLNPEYKINRVAREKPEHFYELKEYITNTYGFISVKNFEADDVVVSLKNYFKDKYNCTILTTDKDVLMLEGRHYNPKKVEWIETSKEDEEMYFLESLLVGDAADNIKGVPGIGPVKARKHIANFGKYNAIKEILGLYIEHFGELKGIQEYYKNYMCLKIVNNIEALGLDETSIPVIREYAGLEIRGLK